MSVIAIITVTKNASASIERTLASVSEQDCDSITHIIIDGSSQDGTRHQIQQFPHRKPCHLYTQTGTGIANAFNEGLAKASSDLVLFLNAGDVLVERNVVSRIVASYQQERWSWASGETIVVSRRGLIRRHVRHFQTWDSSLFLLGNALCHQSTVYTADLIARVGNYDETLSLNMDYDYNLRCASIAAPFHLGFPVAYYDASGVSSVRVFRSFAVDRRIRDRFFSLSPSRRLWLDTRMLFKSIYRLGLVPLKLVL